MDYREQKKQIAKERKRRHEEINKLAAEGDQLAIAAINLTKK